MHLTAQLDPIIYSYLLGCFVAGAALVLICFAVARHGKPEEKIDQKEEFDEMAQMEARDTREAVDALHQPSAIDDDKQGGAQ